MNFKNGSKVWVAGDVTDVNGNEVHVWTITGMKVSVGLKSSLEAMESNNAALELALTNAKKETEDSIGKLREVDEKSAILQENVNSLEAKLLNLKNENHVWRQKALGGCPRGNRAGLLKAVSESFSSILRRKREQYLSRRFLSSPPYGEFLPAQKEL